MPNPETRWWRRPQSLLAFLVVGQLLLGALGVGLWRWQARTTPQPPPLDAMPPIALPVTIESADAAAWARAHAWRDDAQLLSVTMQIDWPWDPPPGPVETLPDTGWLSYVFIAPVDAALRRDEAASLSLLIDRVSGAVVAQSTRGWEKAPRLDQPVATPAVPSATAALVAEAIAGTAFRRDCPAYRHLSRLSLVPGAPSYWLVTYEDVRQRERHGLIAKVDATTGTVIEVTGTAPACTETDDQAPSASIRSL